MFCRGFRRRGGGASERRADGTPSNQRSPHHRAARTCFGFSRGSSPDSLLGVRFYRDILLCDYLLQYSWCSKLNKLKSSRKKETDSTLVPSKYPRPLPETNIVVSRDRTASRAEASSSRRRSSAPRDRRRRQRRVESQQLPTSRVSGSLCGRERVACIWPTSLSFTSEIYGYRQLFYKTYLNRFTARFNTSR